jgi:hypothetical protein
VVAQLTANVTFSHLERVHCLLLRTGAWFRGEHASAAQAYLRSQSGSSLLYYTVYRSASCLFEAIAPCAWGSGSFLPSAFSFQALLSLLYPT